MTLECLVRCYLEDVMHQPWRNEPWQGLFYSSGILPVSDEAAHGPTILPRLRVSNRHSWSSKLGESAFALLARGWRTTKRFPFRFQAFKHMRTGTSSLEHFHLSRPLRKKLSSATTYLVGCLIRQGCTKFALKPLLTFRSALGQGLLMSTKL
ncbi:hypothetical protein SCHPADRAFT_290161 [Schizopora paradoxa]|uniref:Uncharacterized protein n=1 Tax=Schizopora paradoxa TaxID=27342 RepID=A0A0H2RZE5_9AGAM|nr:hypothetical protein SCHPADRAFT_290161 [Schizopora paradoxa]